MGGVLSKPKKPKGPSPEELKRQRELEAQQRKLQESQREQMREQDSEIAEERYKLRKKAKGRASLLSGGAQGIQDTMG